MKTSILLLFVVSVFALPVTAQKPTLPLVEEGRTWRTVSLHPGLPLSMVPIDKVNEFYQDLIKDGSCTASQHDYALKGDTVVNGQTYKKLISSSNKFITGLRQEDKRVYAVNDDSTSEYVLFDFDLKVGDIVKSQIDDKIMMRVGRIDTVLVDGKKCRRLHMWAYEEGTETTDGLVDVWIEGVGCMNGPFFTFAWSATANCSLLLGCYQDNRELVINSLSTTGSKSIKLSSCQTNNAAPYNLQGRRFNERTRQGVYIKNGKKFINE